jgi:hypothetical protein
MTAQLEPHRHYWIAIRKAPQSELCIYGPYLRVEASEYHDQSTEAFPPPAVISTVFKAPNFEDACQNAPMYLPAE